MARSLLSLVALSLALSSVVQSTAFDVPMEDLLPRQEAAASSGSTLNSTAASTAASTASTSTLASPTASSTANSSSTAASPESTPGFVNNGTVGTYPCALPQGFYQENSTRLTGDSASSSQLSYSPDSVPGADCTQALPPVYPYNSIRIRAPDDSIRATFLPYGAALSELWVKDRFGGWRDVVLGFDNKTNYGTDPIHPNFGPTVGRYANRIKNGTFEIDGKTYQIPKNENGFDSLHGGDIGYDRRSWSISNLNDSSVSFTLNDPAGFQGFPGEVNNTVTHSLTNDATWIIRMNALASEKTPILLSSHVYWNLEAYNETQSILDYVFHLPNADRYIETDSILVPTGPIPSVNGTAYDFQTAKPFNELFNQTQGICGAGCQGWDSCWTQKDHGRDDPAIELYSTKSGIKLSVTSDQPAIQVYTCDGISGAKGNLPRKRSHGGDGTLNKFYDNHSCVVLEMEGYIDGINNPEWGQDQIYDASRPYVWESEYKFSHVDENGKAIDSSSTSNSTSTSTLSASSAASSASTSAPASAPSASASESA